MFGGKSKLRKFFFLGFSESIEIWGSVKRLLAPITHKMLTNQLKELEKDRLIIRKGIYASSLQRSNIICPKWEKGLRPVVRAMYEWIERRYGIK